MPGIEFILINMNFLLKESAIIPEIKLPAIPDKIPRIISIPTSRLEPVASRTNQF